MSERLSQSLIESACMSFRHDFGLIPAVQAAVVMAEGESWLAAWRIGFAPYTSSPEAPGLGSGWAEPNSFVVDAACLAFDPEFRSRPFHEASAIRRGGMLWLQAWRHAFDGQPRRDGRIVRLAAPVDGDPIARGLVAVDRALDIANDLSAMLFDHPQRPVIREADEPSVFRSSALADIAAERARQVEGEGWTTDRDDALPAGELARAGACYALHAGAGLGGQTPLFWPWLAKWWKPKKARRDLVRGAALILAEIERGDRLSARGDDPGFEPASIRVDPVDQRAAILIALARDGVPPDVQELLIRGNPTAGVRPDVLGLILGLRAPIAADRP